MSDIKAVILGNLQVIIDRLEKRAQYHIIGYQGEKESAAFNKQMAEFYFGQIELIKQTMKLIEENTE